MLLSRNVLRKLTHLRGISVCLSSFFPRCYSSTSRQEFGRQFEEIAVQTLRRYSFDVSVCGGPKDRGVDFRGVWLLKTSPVSVIGQCRRYKKRLGPRHVRELEGTLTHETKGTLGVLVTENGYSKDAYEAFMGSSCPIALTAVKGFSDEVMSWYLQQAKDQSVPCSFVQDNTGHDSGCGLGHSFGELALKHNGSCKIGIPRVYNYKEKNSIVDKPEKSSQEQQPYGEVTNGLSFHSGSVCVDGNNKNCLTDIQHGENSLLLEDTDNTVLQTNSNVFSQSSEISNDNKCAVGEEGHSLKKRIFESDEAKNGMMDAYISEAEIGVFTLFELNPAARQLLPHLVVGIKYKRWNSRFPELSINEDGSFVNVTR